MRRLGQHFLKDVDVLKRIVSALDIKPTDTIVEIGPGHGELTTHILATHPKKIIAVEKDKNLIPNLRKLGTNGVDLHIINGDALDILPALPKTYNLQPNTYKLVGNIPYYITGKLLRLIGELKKKPEIIILTIQKEVAERLCASPPKMNLLAASVLFWGDPQIVRLVSRNAFSPRPKVESAIVSIKPHKSQKNEDEARIYYQFIKILFNQPRKTVANNITNGLTITKKEAESSLLSNGIDPSLRPQNLDAATINNLSHNLTLNKL